MPGHACRAGALGWVGQRGTQLVICEELRRWGTHGARLGGFFLRGGIWVKGQGGPAGLVSFIEHLLLRIGGGDVAVGVPRSLDGSLLPELCFLPLGHGWLFPQEGGGQRADGGWSGDCGAVRASYCSSQRSIARGSRAAGEGGPARSAMEVFERAREGLEIWRTVQGNGGSTPGRAIGTSRSA